MKICLLDKNLVRTKHIKDATGMLAYNFDMIEKDGYELLCYIDLYSSTFFNRLQMDLFLKEWQRLEQYAENEEDSQFMEYVRNLALEVQKTKHSMLFFIGD